MTHRVSAIEVESIVNVHTNAGGAYIGVEVLDCNALGLKVLRGDTQVTLFPWSAIDLIDIMDEPE